MQNAAERLSLRCSNGAQPSAHSAFCKPSASATKLSVATGLQRLGVRLEVTESVLNHISGSKAGIVGVYQRHDYADEKRTALDAWVRHLMSVVDGAAIR